MVDLDKDAGIWLISLGKADAFGDMATFLTAKKRSYRQFTVPAIAAFTLATGVRGVPMTINTRNNEVRLVYAGVITQQIRDQMVPGILDNTSRHAMFPGVAPTQAIVE
ncbi:MAG TPA: hypothetical protein VGS58_21035 [Candidatus Sulfopaludibacter sp.]|nr:hypothetical protein [Candidatus Sulfopaludibacter sp.]